MRQKTSLPALARLFIFCAALGFGGEALAQDSVVELSASGSLSARSTGSGEDVQFWMTLRNRTKEAVASVRMLGVPPGYDLKQICTYHSELGTRCRDRYTFEKNMSLLAQSLAPGQTLAVSGILRAGDPHDRETLSAIVGWTNPSSTVQSSMALPLGDNLVDSWFQRFTTVTVDLTKSLAIPAALAIFGLFLNNLSKKREDNRAALQKEREEAAQASERIRALRSETWKQMLPVSHLYASKYYLPVSTAAERAIGAVDKQNLRLAYFYFLLLLRRIQATTNEIGGFYFKDLLGEGIAAECVRGFRDAFLGQETHAFSTAIRNSSNLLRSNATYERFESKFWSEQTREFTNPTMQSAWISFKDDVMTDGERTRQTLLYMNALSAVLDHESNRPYEYWYDSKPKKFEASANIQEMLRTAAMRRGFSAVDIEAYFK